MAGFDLQPLGTTMGVDLDNLRQEGWPDAADEIERLRAAIESSASWIERWATHVGNCKAGTQCTCGRNAILYEANLALSNEQNAPGDDK